MKNNVGTGAALNNERDGSSDATSDKYIRVNSLGYYEDISNMDIRRLHGRADYQLIYVKSGEIRVGEPSGDIRLGAGDVCLFRPGEPQLYGIRAVPTSFFWIHFSGSEVEGMLDFFEGSSCHVGELFEFEDYCRELCGAGEFCAERKYTELLCEGGLISLFARIAERISGDERHSRERSLLRPALEVMRSDACRRLTNTELARLCGLSRGYFEKLFKSVMSSTPQQYYATQTIDKGCYLLASTDYSVGEISRLCGLEDSMYFSRFFKKHVGVSPAAYRRQMVRPQPEPGS